MQKFKFYFVTGVSLLVVAFMVSLAVPAIAQVVSSPVPDNTVYEITVSNPQVIFKGTLVQLDIQKKKIQSEIDQLNVQLRNLNETPNPVNK